MEPFITTLISACARCGHRHEQVDDAYAEMNRIEHYHKQTPCPGCAPKGIRSILGHWIEFTDVEVTV